MAFGKKPSPSIQKMQKQDAVLDRKLGSQWDSFAPAKAAKKPAAKGSTGFTKKR